MEDSEFNSLLRAISIAASSLSKQLMSPDKQYTEEVNASGDKSSVMDKLANDYFIESFELNSKIFAGVASEELTNPELFGSCGKYVVVLDPLDGSANLEVDSPVGTIFGVYPIQKEIATVEDFLQPEKNLVAAGYVLYGSKITLVVAHNDQVSQFRIQDLKEVFEGNLVCPEEGKIVAINSGNYPHWNKLTKDWFDTVVEYGKSSFRYMGCMVSDVHRVLLKGGIFAYPADKKNKNGKIRLLYEAAPLVYVLHMAGGSSTNGDALSKNILDIIPTSLHQTTPIFLGSKQNIKDYFRG